MAFAKESFSDLRVAVADNQLASGGAAKKNRLRLLILLVEKAHGYVKRVWVLGGNGVSTVLAVYCAVTWRRKYALGVRALSMS